MKNNSTKLFIFGIFLSLTCSKTKSSFLSSFLIKSPITYGNSYNFSFNSLKYFIAVFNVFALNIFRIFVLYSRSSLISALYFLIYSEFSLIYFFSLFKLFIAMVSVFFFLPLLSGCSFF